MWYPCACIQTAASARALGHRAFRRLRSREHADQGMDSHVGAKRGYLFRNVPQHPLPRVLPPSRFSAVRIPRLMAHTRFLRAHGCAVPPCQGNAPKATVLGVDGRWAMADRLAEDESGFLSP